MGFGHRVDAFWLADGVGGDGHRGAAAAGHGCHFLPEFFGDEGNQGVRQAQQGF